MSNLVLKKGYRYKSLEGHIVDVTDYIENHRWGAPHSGYDHQDGLTYAYSGDGMYNPLDSSDRRTLVKEIGKIPEEIIAKGQRWRYNGLNPHFISSSSMPPIWMYVTVVHDDGENIHYRSDHRPNKVDQTSRERFLEVAELVPDAEYLEVQKQYSATEAYLIDFKLDRRT